MTREAFADAHYFIALLDRDDPWHCLATDFRTRVKFTVTSDLVLIEFLNAMARAKRRLRLEAAELVADLRSRLDCHVVPCSREQFDEALRFYISRPDKDWSMTDCSSFIIMQELSINAALTADKHFAQAGLDALLLQ